MTEDKLRALLRAEAETLMPAGDGLAKIQARLVRRKRARWILLPGAALAVSGAAVAVLTLGGDPRTTLTVEPGVTPSPTNPVPTFTCPGSDVVVVGEGPCPTATAAVPVTTVSGVWPFTSVADAAGWTADGSRAPWAGTARGVADHLVSDFLALEGVTVGAARQPALDGVTFFNLASGDLTLARVQVTRLGAGGPWTLTGVQTVAGTDLEISTPAPGATVGSPLSVVGRITGLDENVQLRLLTSRGDEVAQAGAPAGSEAPWQATLSWTDTSWSRGALVAVTRSMKDGSVNRLRVVAVTRGASAGPSFAALSQGHVALFDAATGAQVRQLTFPPAGASDTGLARAATTTAWVRTRPTGCHDSLNQLVDGGAATTVVADGTVRIAAPRLSPSAALLAWTQTPCGGEQRSVVVRGGGAPDRVLAAPTGMTAEVRDVTDAGALLVHLNDVAATDAGTLGLLPAGAQTFDALVPLAPTGSCYLAGAAAFDSGPTAWETCDGRSRLVRFSTSGTRVSAGPLVDATAITSASARDGRQVLEVRARSGGPTVALYRDEALTYLSTCSPSATDCLSAPDW